MNQYLFPSLFWSGLAVIIWVGSGFVTSNPVAFALTLLMGFAYLVGIQELRLFRRATASLEAALDTLPERLVHLDTWLAQLDPSLQQAVRLRFAGERHNLPGPLLTPYLVGLLVMLGMLGTFIGMVVSFNGTVFALEGTTDLVAIRSALATPIKGLGLAFGTSVAGVASSAVLGLLVALCRRERLRTGQKLDHCMRMPVLHEHTLSWQRQQNEQEDRARQAQYARLLQEVTDFLPQLRRELVEPWQTAVTHMQDMNRQLVDELSRQQMQLHSQMENVYGELARRVDSSLRDSLAQAAQAAGERIQPVLENALTCMVTKTGVLLDQQQTQADALLQARMAAEDRWVAEQTVRLNNWQQGWIVQLDTQMGSLGARLEKPLARLIESASAAQQASREAMVEMREQVSASLARDSAQLAERSRLLAQLDSLLEAADGASQRLAEASVQVTVSGIDVASLAGAFQQTATELVQAQASWLERLGQTAAALDNAQTRSDEQLAYYIAQARELIELSVLSQKDVVDAMRHVARPAALAETA